MSDDYDILRSLGMEFTRDAARFSNAASKQAAERSAFAGRYLPLARLLVERGCMLEKDVPAFLRGQIETSRLYCFLAMALTGLESVNKQSLSWPPSVSLAKHRAHAVFREWNDVANRCEPGTGYYAEFIGVLDDAVQFGFEAGQTAGAKTFLDTREASNERDD